MNISQNVGVSYHHALGPASCAACVNESKHRFRVMDQAGRNIVLNFQGIFIEYPLPRHLHGGVGNEE